MFRKLFQSYVKKENFNNMHKETTACQTCWKLVLNYRVHFENKHTEEAEIKFKCKVCGKDLANLTSTQETTPASVPTSVERAVKWPSLIRATGNSTKEESMVLGVD